MIARKRNQSLRRHKQHECTYKHPVLTSHLMSESFPSASGNGPHNYQCLLNGFAMLFLPTMVMEQIHRYEYQLISYHLHRQLHVRQRYV